MVKKQFTVGDLKKVIKELDDDTPLYAYMEGEGVTWDSVHYVRTVKVAKPDRSLAIWPVHLYISVGEKFDW